jgi:SAM-dependent methyltransferase
MTEPSYLDRIRVAYDTVAVTYAERLEPELAAKPLERAMLAAFADLVRAGGGGPVADVGCGPGHVTARLNALGLDAFGVDLSPAMLAQARRAYPALRFEEASMTALELPDGVLGGVVARYSIIHLPPERLPSVFAEFHRVLSPGGHVLLVFQVGDERLHVEQAFGHAVSVDAYRLSPDRVTELLGAAGLPVIATLLREPDETEKVPQANLLARKTRETEAGPARVTAGPASLGQAVSA